MSKRNELTEQTKKNIITAFWQIFDKKGLRHITAKEIASVAGYNRSTFYFYFSSVDDILNQEENILIDYIKRNVVEILLPNLVKNSKPDASNLFFYTKRKYLKILLGENGDPKFNEKLKNLILPLAKDYLHIPNDSICGNYILIFCFSVVVSTMLYWYENQDISAEQLLDMIWTMLTNGVLSEYSKLLYTSN